MVDHLDFSQRYRDIFSNCLSDSLFAVLARIILVLIFLPPIRHFRFN